MAIPPTTEPPPAFNPEAHLCEECGATATALAPKWPEKDDSTLNVVYILVCDTHLEGWCDGAHWRGTYGVARFQAIWLKGVKVVLPDVLYGTTRAKVVRKALP